MRKVSLSKTNSKKTTTKKQHNKTCYKNSFIQCILLKDFLCHYESILYHHFHPPPLFLQQQSLNFQWKHAHCNSLTVPQISILLQLGTHWLVNRVLYTGPQLITIRLYNNHDIIYTIVIGLGDIVLWLLPKGDLRLLQYCNYLLILYMIVKTGSFFKRWHFWSLLWEYTAQDYSIVFFNYIVYKNCNETIFCHCDIIGSPKSCNMSNNIPMYELLPNTT